MKKLLLVALLLVVCSFIGCGGSGGSTPPPSTPTLVGIQVTPANPSVAPGAIQQFTATGSFSDGTTKSLTSTANWLSSAPAVATINTAGVATGVTGGTTTISASSGGITGSTTLTVANPLVSIAVTPSAIALAPGATQQYTAIGTFADKTTQDLTATATWQSSSSTIASISSPGGLATAVAPGNVTISATSNGITGSASLTVNNPLVSIAVTPANPSVAPLTKQSFTATGTYLDSAALPPQDITTAVTWASSNPAAATISNSPGSQGIATVLNSPGQTTNISATMGSISGSTQLTVKNVTIQSILVTPVNPTISLALQQQFTATATLSDGSQQDITNSVNWTSGDTSKVTIAQNSGLATAVGVTSTPVTITATFTPNGVSGSTNVTVNAASLLSIAISPANVTTLAQRTSQQFSATGTFTNGSTRDITNQVKWASSDTTLASVGANTGLVIAQPVTNQHNSVNITATLSPAAPQTQTLDITNATPTSVTVTPVSATIQPGAIQIFHATGVFTFGPAQDISRDCSWTSSDTTKALVTGPGRVQGVASTGSTPVVITATFSGAYSGIANLSVSSASLVSIALVPNQINLTPGATSSSIQAIGTYSDSSTANLSGVVNWTSSDTTVVKVAGGVAVGQGPGNATVKATDPATGVFGTSQVVVTASPLTAINITPLNPTTYVGVAIQLAAIGTAGSQQINLTSSATWASSNPAVATVSNANSRQGIVTGVGTGSATITAVFAGITGTTVPPLNVSSATITKLVITPVNPTLAVGSNLQFKATGTFSDGKTVDLTSQVTWNSSAPNVAPINTTGLASGAVAGTTTISASFTQAGQTTAVSDQTTLTVQ